MKCKRPKRITEHMPMNSDEIHRSVRHLYPYCGYLIATSEKCVCPYDYCIMDSKISLKEEK